MLRLLMCSKNQIILRMSVKKKKVIFQKKPLSKQNLNIFTEEILFQNNFRTPCIYIKYRYN